MEADRCEARPIGWILEQLSGQPNVEIIYFYPPDPPHSPLDPEYKRMKAEFKEQGNFLLPDEDDADL
ncbi:ras family-domain-containing protein [Penicillium manginii]|uniref:ras family-domain-containing protein n=1 Tax=Penicillium manginii TaxID=203109 RepID=UPI002546B388|nr:ras family-domain-containing protein [Penicillium manginii]KAJ5744054.1 ras family-domain-containing protein [Penicillium manginii]